MARLLFASNDGRSRHLKSALESLGHDTTLVDFDHVGLLTKAAAGLLSWSSPRMEWWQNYQTSPLVQASRRRAFTGNARALKGSFDATVMWGSWFEPSFVDSRGVSIPYVYYVDQSRSVVADPAEQAPRIRRPKSGWRLQNSAYARSLGVMGMSEWTVAQTLQSHPNLPSGCVEWAGWGPCAFDDSSVARQHVQGAPLVLHVGNDFHRKGVDWLVETAKLVKAQLPNARFVVVGSDQSSTTVDFGDVVEFVGAIREPAILLEYFRQASIFFLPNRFERAGHVLIEAMSAGVPLVVSKQGGPAELVADGKVGIGVDPGDISGYAAAILQLLENPERRSAMGAEGKVRARGRYSWIEVARRICYRIPACDASRSP